MSVAIKVENLTKYYGNFLAVDHIAFEVREGEIFGFLGPNGAGKTTTQRMLTTLLEPTDGRVTIFGHDLAGDAYSTKQQIGLVPEESNVYAELTAWDNLIFTARLYRNPRAARSTRAQELLETFDLWEKRNVKVENYSKGMRRRLSIARLLALTTFFTAAAAGPFIIPLERRLGTYDRLLAAPMSLPTLLLGKTAVGAFFAFGTSAFALLIGILIFGSQVAWPWLRVVSIILASFSFSALGLIFGSIPTRDPGAVQMPSTLLRWGLLFISGVFIPLPEMPPLARAVAYLSPLTYAQDLMDHAVISQGLLNLWLDLVVLLLSGILFIAPSAWMHRRSRRLGY